MQKMIRKIMATSTELDHTFIKNDKTAYKMYHIAVLSQLKYTDTQ